MLPELAQLPADHGAERNPSSAEAVGNETDCRAQHPDLAQILLADQILVVTQFERNSPNDPCQSDPPHGPAPLVGLTPEGVMFDMMRDGMTGPMTWGMGIGMTLVALVLILGAIALAKYIFSR